ncbi:MAG: glycosyltransferase family 2 protein [Chthoniobacterales bacterium]
MRKLSNDASVETLSLVIPLYNEAENLPILQDQIEQALEGYDYAVIFVDDGSTDSSAKSIRHTARTEIIRFESNAGQSAAMVAGMQKAKGDIIIFLDADLQNDPADIPLLVEEIQKGADLVCGYRKYRQDTFVKRLTGKIANTFRRALTGDEIRDSGCTLKAMRKSCRHALPLFRGMHRFIPALIKAHGYRIAEISVNHRPRKFGKSKYGLYNRAFHVITDLFGVFWLTSRRLDYKIISDATYAPVVEACDPKNNASIRP